MNNTLNNTVISWSDSFETKTVAGESTQSTTYYFINSELVAKKNPDSSRYYFHNDHLSSSTIVTNSGGTPIEQTKYDPWGDILSGGTKSKFLYTGQEKDTETNLNYYNARYYSSDMRRFTQPDTIIQDAYSPQTLNRYSYVLNNPLKYTDPTGHITTSSVNPSPLSVFLWLTLYSTSPQGQLATKTIVKTVLQHNINTAYNTYVHPITQVIGAYNATKTAIAQAKPVIQPQSKTQPSTQLVPQIPQMGNTNLERNWKQDKRLNKGEIERLKRGGENIEKLKDERSDLDLFKDPKTGEIRIKPKAGDGPGEKSGLNINDF